MNDRKSAEEMSKKLIAMEAELAHFRSERKRLLEEERAAGEWRSCGFATYEEYAEADYGPFVFEEIEWTPEDD